MNPPVPEAPIGGQFLRFAFVGGAGFVVDEGMLALLHLGFGVDPLSARIVSILTAMTFTWWGNRTFTFPEHAASGATAVLGEWLRFVAANGIGALLNYGTFVGLLRLAAAPLGNPFLATAIGVGVGMVWNFLTSRALVFRARADED